MSAITRCPLYRVSAIDRYDCTSKSISVEELPEECNLIIGRVDEDIDSALFDDKLNLCTFVGWYVLRRF